MTSKNRSWKDSGVSKAPFRKDPPFLESRSPDEKGRFSGGFVGAAHGGHGLRMSAEFATNVMRAKVSPSARSNCANRIKRFRANPKMSHTWRAKLSIEAGGRLSVNDDIPDDETSLIPIEFSDAVGT